MIRELEIFDALRARVAAEAARIQDSARALATLDVLASLADVAALCYYMKPLVHDGDDLAMTDGRHPVVERRTRDPFVPNDLTLDGDAQQLIILTGPNMGGKSTYLRQAALICIMAQAGSFVPARSAKLPILDRVFARVGASDNIARGQSTFMVEMQETARNLHTVTSRSLVVLDEIGRGTATFDGLSIAWAVAEHLATHARARPLVARCSATAQAMLRPSKVDVPRPISSRLTRLREVAEWRMRTGFLDAIAAMGATVSLEDQRDAGPEPVAALVVRGAAHELRATEIAGDLAVRSIDELPILAVLAARAKGTTVVRDAEELRVKESDRIATTCAMLASFGIACEVRPDGFTVEGRPDRPLEPGRVHAEGDHRIAMAAAIAGLVATGETVIDDADNVATSYPGFAAALSGLGASI